MTPDNGPKRVVSFSARGSGAPIPSGSPTETRSDCWQAPDICSPGIGRTWDQLETAAVLARGASNRCMLKSRCKQFMGFRLQRTSLSCKGRTQGSRMRLQLMKARFAFFRNYRGADVWHRLSKTARQRPSTRLSRRHKWRLALWTVTSQSICLSTDVRDVGQVDTRESAGETVVALDEQMRVKPVTRV